MLLFFGVYQLSKNPQFVEVCILDPNIILPPVGPQDGVPGWGGWGWVGEPSGWRIMPCRGEQLALTGILWVRSCISK